MTEVSTATVLAEVAAWGGFHGLAPEAVVPRATRLEPHLRDYAELALAEDGFELITGGTGPATARSLAGFAALEGASPPVLSAFTETARRFPSAHLGLKIGFGATRHTPSLYVRTLLERTRALELLAPLLSADALAGLGRALAGSRTLYGLAYFGAGARPGVKTYAIADVAVGDLAAPGFVSRRLIGDTIVDEQKRYLPDIPWDRLQLPTPRLRALAEFAGARLDYRLCGHFAVVGPIDAPGRCTLYVERRGHIPTDFAAR